jgi:PAS domain S-box-containing protein
MRPSKRFILSLLGSIPWWLGIVLSLVFAQIVTEMVEDKNRSEFDYQVSNAQLALETRLRSYIDVLRSANALFYSGDNISREQFHAYVTQLQLQHSFPGIVNLSFARRVTANDKKTFEANVRADSAKNASDLSGFTIRPAGARAQYHVVTYIEPMEGNRSLLGIDLAASEWTARLLATSRDTGQLASFNFPPIGKPHDHTALTMRMPLYRRGMPADTVEQRRNAYYGSLGAEFDIGRLMAGAIDRKTLPFMRLQLYDAGSNSEIRAQDGHTRQLLLDTSAEGLVSPSGPQVDDKFYFIKNVSMKVGPQIWEAQFSASKTALMNRFDIWLPWLVMLIGLIASVLMYSIYYSLMSARRHAVELARDMTKDLRESEDSLAEAQHMAHLGSWLLDTTTKKMTWSAETFLLFGLTRFGIAPDLDDFLRRVHDEDRTRVAAGLQRVIESGEEFTVEHRIRQCDGSIRWVKAIARIANKSGRTLLRGTLMDITELKRMLEALKRSQALLRDLTTHQDRVKEEERRRIAREIHDELGQTLLALRIDVSMLEARTGKSHPRLNSKVREVLQHLDATVKTIRTIINNLRPAVLDLGLAAAIEWQVAEFRRRSGISCDVQMDENEFSVDDTRATTLFRVLQESLTNVIRHANATHVHIELQREGKGLAMKIADNGIGIYQNRRKSVNSFGLIGVEERIHALNGEFSISSTPGQGTTLMIYIPLESRDESASQLAL